MGRASRLVLALGSVSLAFVPQPPRTRGELVRIKRVTMGFLWVILIGFIAGIIARLVSPGPNKPSGFILTTVLGIAGAFLVTFIGQAIGWYRPDQGAGIVGAVIGAFIVLFVWNRLVVRHVISDPGAGARY
jgi:uncharacterized membrane protein YeaQ/YmgE (transglycosylase-associated protein family)